MPAVCTAKMCIRDRYEIYTYTVPGIQKGSEKSLAVINETLFYKGRNGVYAYSGGTPELLTENFGTRRFFDAVGGTDGERYYISMRTEKGDWELYVFDTLRAIWQMCIRDSIVAEAQAKAKETLEAAKETAPAAPKPNDLVPIRLFKDNDKYKDDVFVAVNGRSFQIKRGETVQVPAYVAEVLEQSMAQDNATANLIERESSAYAAEAKARNI